MGAAFQHWFSHAGITFLRYAKFASKLANNHSISDFPVAERGLDISYFWIITIWVLPFFF